MLQAFENKNRDPDLGFSLFTVIEFQQMINLIKTKRLKRKMENKPRDGGNQQFYTVSFSDLYDHNLLLYVGSDCMDDSFVKETIVDTFPELVRHYLFEDGYWSFFKLHHQHL